jgi:tRNA modification GTPase
VVLVCAENPSDLSATSAAVRRLSEAPQVRVLTKSDLRADVTARDDGALSVSAHQRDGLEELLTSIERSLDANYGSLDPDLPLLTRARHQAVLTEAARELEFFSELRTNDSVPVSIAAVHLRSAVHALETLVGAVDVEDVLSRVFSTFCVGK